MKTDIRRSLRRERRVWAVAVLVGIFVFFIL